MKKLQFLLLILLVISCNKIQKKSIVTDIKSLEVTPFDWQGANIYFLLTDRFNNADTSNDINFERTEKTAKLRGFEGGDFKGVTQKIKENYFTNLGINAIWLNPVNEQIHGATDEGTGLTYGYHGYWIKDWTAIDPNFGTPEDLKELVDEAHKRDIRILLDAVINHTGPVTELDPVWPSDWVRTEPQCQFDNYEHTVNCTLVQNLPDVKTENNKAVDLPPQLVQKWKAEGRYEQEVAELNAFFERTGYPRAPRYYIIKWLTDYITDYGIDGYRCDTVKHTEALVWQEFRTECDYAFRQFKKNNPDKVLDDNGFYLVSEVYNYGISNGRDFDFGDRKVDYFDGAFDAAINFEFKWNAQQKLPGDVFVDYDSILQNQLKGKSVLNYLTSHDDGQPFDLERKLSMESATWLLLSPGASQVYYGDELSRPLIIEGAMGDANLRSNMNWEELPTRQHELMHWQKLGQFRAHHPAIGAGKHEVLNESPYVFSRIYLKDKARDAVIVLYPDNTTDHVTLSIKNIFPDTKTLRDAYSGIEYSVDNGHVTVPSKSEIVLLELN